MSNLLYVIGSLLVMAAGVKNHYDATFFAGLCFLIGTAVNMKEFKDEHAPAPKENQAHQDK